MILLTEMQHEEVPSVSKNVSPPTYEQAIGTLKTPKAPVQNCSSNNDKLESRVNKTQPTTSMDPSFHLMYFPHTPMILPHEADCCDGCDCDFGDGNLEGCAIICMPCYALFACLAEAIQ